jgi:arginine exporter protein ArgO
MTREPSDRGFADRDDRRYAGTAVQKVSLIVGIVFLIVGIAGFIPGLTTNLDQLSFAGHDSMAMLLGVFQVSVLHNIVHLLYGIAGVALASTRTASRAYLIWGGVIYAVIWLYGLFFGGDMPANFVPLNSADNWLHLFLAVAMILLGILLSPRGAGVNRSARAGA